MATASDEYLNTVGRLEPDIHFIDAAAGWASVAVSAKRIADSLERLAVAFEKVVDLIPGDEGP